MSVPISGSSTTRRIHAAVCARERGRRTISTIPRAQTIASGMRMKTQTAVDAGDDGQAVTNLHETYPCRSVADLGVGIRWIRWLRRGVRPDAHSDRLSIRERSPKRSSTRSRRRRSPNGTGKGTGNHPPGVMRQHPRPGLDPAMRAACSALAVVMLALALGACGESGRRRPRTPSAMPRTTSPSRSRAQEPDPGDCHDGCGDAEPGRDQERPQRHRRRAVGPQQRPAQRGRGRQQGIHQLGRGDR